MTTDISIADCAAAVAFAALGLLVGLGYFAAMRRTVTLLADGSTWFGPLALTVGRIVVVVALLTLVARFGASPLLAAAIGMLLARAIALRTARRPG